MDMHCHSSASSKPVIPLLGLIDMPECYSEPERVYDQARARGMDYITITDHDSIQGALKLVERGFQDFVIGEEVTTYFPEDRCKLHVVVWGLSPEQHDEIGRLGLRQDVYEFASWLEEENLAHALAHPLYVQNGKLTIRHLEKCALLFKGWEVLNGAHSGSHKQVIDRYLAALTPRRVQELSREHRMEPLWSRIWQKGITAGSDDHALLNVGRTWTSLAIEDAATKPSVDAFLRRIMAGHGDVGGGAGHASLLAHQLATVGANYYARRIVPLRSPMHRYIAGKMLRFAGVEVKKPSRVSLLWGEVKRRIKPGAKGSRPSVLLAGLKEQLGPILEKYPDLGANMDPRGWSDGAPIAQHDQMAEFMDELTRAMTTWLARGAVGAARRNDRSGTIDHLIGAVLVQAAQIPYVFSLFHQEKERMMLDRLEHETAEPGSGVSVLERPMRVSWFTDTLGDVNGVCRFIQNMAHQANVKQRDVQVLTSTQFPTPEWPNIFNFEPVFAMKMPKYEQLEIVVPPLMKMLRQVAAHQPDVIHISTPGPVGLIGLLAAHRLKVPVVGTYHTDFPAYVDHLFQDHGLTAVCAASMKMFYGRCGVVLSRSSEFVDSMTRVGIGADRIETLRSGIDQSDFGRRFADRTIWKKLGVGRPNSVKVLYVGRVSVEKNLPMLARVWERVWDAAQRSGIEMELMVVGDGPYRAEMQQKLGAKGAHFLGFRHGEELATIYASCDLFAFPSLTDTLGQSVMEAQVSGLPAIVSDQGGPRTIVAEGVSGRVLNTDDEAAWASALVAYARDPDLRSRHSAEAESRMHGRDIGDSFDHFWDVCDRVWKKHLASHGILPREAGIRSPEGRGIPAAV